MAFGCCRSGMEGFLEEQKTLTDAMGFFRCPVAKA